MTEMTKEHLEIAYQMDRGAREPIAQAVGRVLRGKAEKAIGFEVDIITLSIGLEVLRVIEKVWMLD